MSRMALSGFGHVRDDDTRFVYRCTEDDWHSPAWRIQFDRDEVAEHHDGSHRRYDEYEVVVVRCDCRQELVYPLKQVWDPGFRLDCHGGGHDPAPLPVRAW
jgi:hypothetical protein